MPTKFLNRRRLPAAFAATLLFLSVAACGVGPTPTWPPTPTPIPTPTPLPDPRVILERAAARLLAEKSLAFTLEHPAGGAFLSPGLLLTRAEGVVNTPANRPESFSVTLDLETSGSFLQISVIVVEEGAYVTNLFSGEWEPVARERIPFRVDQINRVVADLLTGTQSPELVGVERTEGYDAYRLRGTTSPKALADLIPGAMADSAVPVELWVESTDSRLRKARLTGSLAAGDALDVVRVLTLKARNSPAQIAVPPLPPR